MGETPLLACSLTLVLIEHFTSFLNLQIVFQRKSQVKFFQTFESLLTMGWTNIPHCSYGTMQIIAEINISSSPHQLQNCFSAKTPPISSYHDQMLLNSAMENLQCNCSMNLAATTGILDEKGVYLLRPPMIFIRQSRIQTDQDFHVPPKLYNLDSN